MKTALTLFALFFSTHFISQELVSKEVGDFSEIKVFDLIEINLIQADENRVEIKGDYSGDVKVINDDGTLKLRMNLDTRFRGEDTHIEVYFKNIDVIDANEGARITVNTVLVQPEIELRSQEGGKITVGLDVDKTNIKAVSGGIVEVSGLSKYQEIHLNSGGILEGKNLKTQRTKIRVFAAGEAELYASEKVDVKITAGGNVYIYGDPDVVNEKRFAGGQIVKM